MGVGLLGGLRACRRARSPLRVFLRVSRFLLFASCAAWFWLMLGRYVTIFSWGFPRFFFTSSRFGSTPTKLWSFSKIGSTLSDQTCRKSHMSTLRHPPATLFQGIIDSGLEHPAVVDAFP